MDPEQLSLLSQQVFTNDLILPKILQYLNGKDLLSFRSVNWNILNHCMRFRGGKIYEKLALCFKTSSEMANFTQEFPKKKNFDFARITEVRFGPRINVGHECDSFLKSFSSNIKIFKGNMEGACQIEDLLYFAHLLRNYNWDKIEEIYLQMEINSKAARPTPDLIGWSVVPKMPRVKIVHLSIAFLWARLDGGGDSAMTFLFQNQFPNAEVRLTPFRTANPATNENEWIF